MAEHHMSCCGNSTARGHADLCPKMMRIEVIGADIDEPADGPHEQRLRDQRRPTHNPSKGD